MPTDTNAAWALLEFVRKLIDGLADGVALMSAVLVAVPIVAPGEPALFVTGTRNSYSSVPFEATKNSARLPVSFTVSVLGSSMAGPPPTIELDTV